ncbi:MAG: pyruvate kinase alpha/beta domain-containing protein [Pelolinea sp.]|nr:pyruvate kinase alpha/beta domain-containing protein [Pelolinea sp.]
MREIKSTTIYFEGSGRDNTERVLELVKQRAKELGISIALVASTTGYTGSLAVKMLSGMEVIVISHVAGYAGPNTQELTDENRKVIETGGGKILTTQHGFAGVNRAIRKKLETYQPNEIIADVLRIFGAGMKVMLEISMMTADAGLIDAGKPVIAVAGTHRGADTAAVVIPENSDNFFDLKAPEIICIPAPGHPLFKK